MYKINEKAMLDACIAAHGEAVGEVVFGIERGKAQAKLDRLNELQAQRAQISQQLTAMDSKHADSLAPLIAARDEIRASLRQAEKDVADQVIANDQERNALLARDTEAVQAARMILENRKPAEWKVPDDYQPIRIEHTLEEIQMAKQYEKDVASGYVF